MSSHFTQEHFYSTFFGGVECFVFGLSVSLLGLGVGPGSVLVQLLFEPALSLVPVEEGAQDGGEAVLGQRAHGAYQLRKTGGWETRHVVQLTYQRQEIAIVLPLLVCAAVWTTTKNKAPNGGTRRLIS